jgi:peptide deformylase
MAVRKILIYPQHQTQLQKVRELVPKLNKKVNVIIHDLKDTLQANSGGIGLATSQITTISGLSWFVWEICLKRTWKTGPPTAMINPQIVDAKNERKDL